MRAALFGTLTLCGCADLLYVDHLPAPVTVAPAGSSDLSAASQLRYYAMDGLLKVHVQDVVDGTHLVQYDAMNRSPEAVQTVRDSEAQLAGVDPLALANPDEQLAFWLNRYNLAMVGAVLEQRAADPGYASVSADDFAIFSQPMATVSGFVLTLDQIEHAVLRGEVGTIADADLRAQVEAWHAAVWAGGAPNALLHVGLNCASLGCPNLRIGTFAGDTVWDELDAAAVEFVDDRAKGAGPNGVSELFTWFAADFDDTFGGADAFVAAYRSGGTSDVDFGATIPYDWSLNAATP